MEKGILYWITGLSGSGKTTIGSSLYYELKKRYSNLVILDGDILKKLTGDSLGYSKEDRLKRAGIYSNFCKILTDQGISVIICTVAMYDSVRQWNRNHIERYVEIFLDVEKAVLMERDKKGLYSGQLAGKVSDVAGLDIEVEFPKNPDIILKNNGNISVAECVKRILDFEVKEKDSFKRDMAYWDSYYRKKAVEIQKPSEFAKVVLSNLQPGKSLIDLGCGNGRDSVFFVENNLAVTGIDISEEAISQLNQMHLRNANFVCDDFVTSKVLYQIQYDYVYSRWTMHAISESQEEELLQNVCKALKPDGLFFIEARSIHDELYGKGKRVGENAYIFDEHYRRFMDKERFIDKMEKAGFIIHSAVEGRDFSKTQSSNPVLIRIIASVREDGTIA